MTPRSICLTLLLATTVSLAAAGHGAMAGLLNENLLVGLPTGFKVGFSSSNGRESMQEFVPQAESVEDWNRMVTVQIFFHQPNASPGKFAENLARGWTQACPGGTASEIATPNENNYPVAVWSYVCPLNPATHKPEIMWLKVISGQDSIYSVQYAFRRSPDKALQDEALGYLKGPEACDTRGTDHPCPKGM